MQKPGIPSDVFFLDPAKEYIVTGRYNFARLVSQYAWLLGALLGIFVFSAENIALLIQEYRLDTGKSATTTGKISSCSSGGSKNSSAMIIYTFDVHEKVFSAQEKISSCDDLAAGKDILITYLKDNPDVSRTGNPGFKSPPIGGILTTAILSIMIIWVAIVLRIQQKEKAIKKQLNQRIIIGKLKRSKKVLVGRASIGKYCIAIAYTFSAEQNRRILDYAACIRGDLKELPSAGRPVAILYTDAQNYTVI